MNRGPKTSAIQTNYAGCRFRSRLEARWAVFFDAMGIPWEYEPQGYTLSDGKNYLPDFLLTECGTWVEVKGNAQDADPALLQLAAADLPRIKHRGEHGPKLLILGPIPTPTDVGDYGWCGLQSSASGYEAAHYGFGQYQKNRRPWWIDGSSDPWCGGNVDYLKPFFAPEENGLAQVAYRAAKSARFEHGDIG
jgi:hypothetical protein